MRQKEKPVNSFKFELESRSINESLARSCIAALIAQLDPTVDELADIRTAVSEAVTNCIVHAYPDQLGKIYISRRPLPGRTGSHPGEGQGLRDFRRAARDGAAFHHREHRGTFRTRLFGDAEHDGQDRGKIETGRPDRRHPRKEAAIER